MSKGECKSETSGTFCLFIYPGCQRFFFLLFAVKIERPSRDRDEREKKSDKRERERDERVFFPLAANNRKKKPLAPRVLFIKLRIINSHTMTHNKINVRITGPPPHEFRPFYNFAHQNRIFFKALTRCGHFGSTKRICEFV